MVVQIMPCPSAVTAIYLLHALRVSTMPAVRYFRHALLCNCFMCLIMPANAFLKIQLSCTWDTSHAPITTLHLFLCSSQDRRHEEAAWPTR